MPIRYSIDANEIERYSRYKLRSINFKALDI